MAEYRGLFFGEGGKDKRFLRSLTTHEKFMFHTKRWSFQYDNASGGSPMDVLVKCRNVSSEKDYDGVFCVIDQDVLKMTHPDDWQEEKARLGKVFSNIVIVWHEDNLEDEQRRVLGERMVEGKGKMAINNLSLERIDSFINTEYYQRLLGAVQPRKRPLT